MRLEEIIVVQHSHTDIGFTHDQPIVREIHARFLDEAIRLAEEHAGDKVTMKIGLSYASLDGA